MMEKDAKRLMEGIGVGTLLQVSTTIVAVCALYFNLISEVRTNTERSKKNEDEMVKIAARAEQARETMRADLTNMLQVQMRNLDQHIREIKEDVRWIVREKVGKDED